MKKYIYFLEDREIWFLLAKKLKDENIAEPVMCFWDEKNFSEYREIFTDCVFFDYAKSNIWFFEDKIHSRTSWIEGILSVSDFLKFKEQSIKMMDRSDLFWWFRNIDRNDIFYSMLLHFYSLIKEKSPNFILMSWTPHTVSSFIVYNICKYLGIESFTFDSSSIVPILLMRKGINGDFIDIPASLISKNTLIESKLERDIQKFLKKFQKDSFEDPIYMKIQKKWDTFSIINLWRNIRKNISLLMFSRIEYYGFSAINNTISIFDKILFYFLRKKIVNANIASMRNNQLQNIQIKKWGYVYFPLHYEPERTTNPDGGDYYDQIKALIALRWIVPSHIPIYVKEHYSQFTNALQWYRGRGRFFYSAISKIENVHIVDMGLNSVTLIKNALCTVSITGTTILESICFEIPSIIMWNSWFENFTGVTKFKEILDLQQVLENKGSIHSFHNDIKNLISKNGIFGTIGKSNAVFYTDYYSESTISDTELNNIFQLVKISVWS